jgi:CelD/BcsL family acetyltransferase involved in cellulose biosynthesis
MNLPATIEEVYLRRSGKHRKRLRSEARKLQSKFDGHLQIRCFREPSELETAILLVEETAKRTYQRGLGVGFEDTPRMRSLLHLYSRKGWLRMYVLIAADVPIAFWVGAVYEGWFYSDCTGYDPRFREDAPGTYLFMKMIEDFCEEGLHGIDFGLGDAAYKEQFGDQSFEEATIYIFSTRIKGLTLRAFHAVMFVTNAFLRKILAHTKLLMKVKRLWRDRLAQKDVS